MNKKKKEPIVVPMVPTPQSYNLWITYIDGEKSCENVESFILTVYGNVHCINKGRKVIFGGFKKLEVEEIYE